MIKLLKVAVLCVMALLASCGGSGSGFDSDVPTNTYPIVSRLDPSTAAVGDEVTIYGLGFSYSPPVDVITVGDQITSATTYALVDPAQATSSEVEMLTFTVPANVRVGENSVTVLVHANLSNSNVLLTVVP